MVASQLYWNGVGLFAGNRGGLSAVDVNAGSAHRQYLDGYNDTNRFRYGQAWQPAVRQIHLHHR